MRQLNNISLDIKIHKNNLTICIVAMHALRHDLIILIKTIKRECRMHFIILVSNF